MIACSAMVAASMPDAASGPAPDGASDALPRHQIELRLAGRCPHCAEEVPRLAQLRGKPCPHCKQLAPGHPRQASSELIEALRKRWARWRFVAYPLLAFATGIAGLVPLLATPARILGLIVIHVAFVRRPLSWLPFKRRLASKLTLRLLLAALGITGMLVDAVVAPLPLVNGIVSGIVSVAAAVVYAEVALRFAIGRMQREAETSELSWWEWLLPTSLLGALVGITFLMALAIAGLFSLLTADTSAVTGWVVGDDSQEQAE